ncbi:unnamed protein product [Chrysoparadoxa australica]
MGNWRLPLVVAAVSLHSGSCFSSSFSLQRGGQAGSPAQPGDICRIESPMQFEGLWDGTAQPVTLVSYHASWCRKCMYVGGRLRQRHEFLPEDLCENVRVASIDVNAVAAVPTAQNIQELPTLIAYGPGGQELGRYVGSHRGDEFWAKVTGLLSHAMHQSQA